MNLLRELRTHKVAVVAALALAAGCSSDDPKSPTAPPASPVDPAPAPVVYAVTVSPSKPSLEVGTTDSATVTIRATRTDTGAAAPNLTKLSLSTSLGSFGAVGGPQQLEAEFVNGQVQVAFFGGGTVGTATIRAQVTGTGISTTSVGFGTVRIFEGEIPTFFLSSVSPNTGSPQGGDVVNVLGGGFDPPVRVLFGGVAATVRSTSETSIRVEVPALASGLPAGETQPVSVSVTINLNEEGQASDTLASGFTYVNGGEPGVLQPTVFSLAPASGPNEGGTEVVINGDGFESPVQVKFGEGSTDANFNGTEAQILSVSRTRIVVKSPRTLVEGSSGRPLPNDLSDVLVKNLNTGRFTVASSAFKYGNEVIITSIGPGEGPSTGGQQVTIYGQGFDEPVAVSLADFAQQVLSVSGTEIVVLTVPVQITNCQDISGPSSVTNIETGDGDEGPDYTYRVPATSKPIITGISPSSGGQAGGLALTISGANFTDPVIVEFIVNGNVYSVVVTSLTSTTIGVVSPQVSDSVMSSQACDDDGDDTQGTELIPTSATVRVTNVGTGCSYESRGLFTIIPTSSACVGD